MPALINPRHEKFAQLVAGGSSGTKAYIAAGFSPGGAAPSATKLLKKQQVAERVAELKAALSEATVNRAALSREAVLDRLSVLSSKAEAEGQFSAAIRAEELRGKELGMFVDRSDQKIKLDKAEDLGPAELERLIAAAKAKAESGGEERVQ